MLLSIYGSCGYLISVYVLSKFMRHKHPFYISPYLLGLYNIYQIVANGYIGYQLYNAVHGDIFGIYTVDNMNIRYFVYLHYLTKYIDLIDTLIIILRKKTSQLSFLHIYHHSTVVVIWDYVVHTMPFYSSAVYMYGAFINSWIHVVMYMYYGAASLNIKIHPMLKKSITSCQLLQFVSCVFHAIVVMLLKITQVQYSLVQLMYHISLFRLFYPLLYNKSQQKSIF